MRRGTTVFVVSAVGLLGTRALAAPAGELGRCTPTDFRLELTVDEIDGGVRATVDAARTRGGACTFAARVRLAVRDRDGVLGGLIRGNPGHWLVRRRLSRSAPLRVHTWLWRNWCYLRHRFVMTADAGVKRATTAVPTPRCVRRDRASLLDPGPGTRPLPPPGDPIPAHILDPSVPIPVSPSLIRVTNAWLVSDGITLVAVYAGEAGNDPNQGLFVVIRQDLVAGIQTRDIVPVGQTGAVTITSAPRGRAVEKSAQRADIGFSSASGARGVLHLADDSIGLLPV